MSQRLFAVQNHLTPQNMTSRIPLPSEGAHGEENGRATATCYCGTVQIEVPTEKPGLVDTFICHCTDCHKLTASMFSSIFIVKDAYLKHIRGEDKLTRRSQNKTTESGKHMEDSFCSVCGTLMYRRSEMFPGHYLPRIGTIDDFGLQETKFKPRIEVYGKDRCAWVGSADVQKHVQGGSLSG